MHFKHISAQFTDGKSFENSFKKSIPNIHTTLRRNEHKQTNKLCKSTISHRDKNYFLEGKKTAAATTNKYNTQQNEKQKNDLVYNSHDSRVIIAATEMIL